jgi:pyruvate dehydrogenase E1 component alpha subunit
MRRTGLSTAQILAKPELLKEQHVGDPLAHAISQEEALKAYHDMLLIRRFEERSAQLYGMGLIAGFCHLYIGQEAVVVGIQSILKPQDTTITAYRDHGHMLACGMDPKGVMAELTGRSGGYSKGKGGSMHMFSREKNFFGGHGIVGAQISIGTGLAFAHKYKEDEGVCIAYMGDGAANQGQVYESYNMAALWDLPVVYIIENNQYGMGTSVARSAAGSSLYERGKGWDIPGECVDGMEYLKVKAAAKRAVDHARSGKGPYILEMDTYRYRGHSMSDPATYRPKGEVERIKEERDPLDHFKTYLEEAFKIPQDQLKKIEDEVKAVVLEAVEFSKTSPEPDPSELYTDVLNEEV